MTETRAERLLKIKAVDVAAYHLQPDSKDGKQGRIQTIQSSHRLDVIYAWLTGADPRASCADSDEGNADYTLLCGDVMDLGCGQGDQTAALAALVAAHPDQFSQDAKRAKITGVDAAPATYGSPYTLEQAQDHLSKQAGLRKQLSFVLGKTGGEVLETQKFDTVVLSHSLWYFASADVLKDTFRAMREAGVKHLLLAEWGMTASHPNAVPHVVAALLQTQCPLEKGNVRTVLSPDQLKKMASEAGWKVKRELSFVPAEELQDGGWEVHMAREAAENAARLDTQGDKTKQKLVQSVEATRYALEEAAKRCGKQIRSMDVWTAVLTPA